MITRIDIKDGSIVLPESIPDNWIVEIKLNRLWVVALSNAKKTNKRVTSIPVQDGSLFLQNSTHDWYYYFRVSALQTILDKYKINRIIANRKVVVTVCIDTVTGKLIEPIYLEQENPLADVEVHSQFVADQREVIALQGILNSPVCIVRSNDNVTAYVEDGVDLLMYDFTKLERKEIDVNDYR